MSRLVATRLTYNGYDCLFPCRTGTTSFRHLYMGGGEALNTGFEEVKHSLFVVELWKDEFLQQWYDSKMPRVLFIRDPYERYLSAKRFIEDVKADESATKSVKEFLGDDGIELFHDSHVAPIYNKIVDMGSLNFDIFKFEMLKDIPIQRAASKNREEFPPPDWLSEEYEAYYKIVNSCKVCENLHSHM